MEKEEQQLNWVEQGFAQFSQELNSKRPERLKELAVLALPEFLAKGFPTTAEEDWKFTNLKPYLRKPFIPAREVRDFAPKLLAGAPDFDGRRIVFVDGYAARDFAAFDSLKSGLHVFSLAGVLRGDCANKEVTRAVHQHFSRHASADNAPLINLNTAFLSDGAVVFVGRGCNAESPVHIVFAASEKTADRISFPRVLVVAEEGSQVTVVETYLGQHGTRYCTTAVTEIAAEPGAVVDHVRLVLEGAECLHLSALEAAAAENSVVSTQCFSLGGACVRNEAVVHLRGGGANALLAGLSLINKEQHVDNHTVIEHAVAHCASRELYKGIYAEQAQGVFDGTIVVRPQAQKTNAFQSSQSLLLSREACVNSKPQLKIWADDVKCTHGATAGQLDDDALFYLRSRGIEKNEARRILMQAFAGDVVKEVKNDAVRTMIEALVEKRLVELPVDFA